MSNLESEYYMQQNYWWKLKKGRGIRVKIIDDMDKETGKQKYRPAIVIKSYPYYNLITKKKVYFYQEFNYNQQICSY